MANSLLLLVCGEGGAPIVRAPGRRAVSNAGGTVPRALDAAPGAARSGAARCIPIGLPPPAKPREHPCGSFSAYRGGGCRATGKG